MKRIQAWVLVLGMSVCGMAWADVIPPNQTACQSKQEGDSCQTTDNLSGTCTKDKCTRLDYSDGTPPSSVEYDCLICKSSSSTDNANNSSTNSNNNKNGNNNTSNSGGSGCRVMVDSPVSLGFRLFLLLLLGLGTWRLFTSKAPKSS